MTAYIAVDDRFLERKLVLELCSQYKCITDSVSDYHEGAVYITDGSVTLPFGIIPDAIVADGKDLPKQFPIGALLSYLSAKARGARLSMRGARECILDGEAIKLTELEGALLCALIEAGGELVDRDTLCERIFGGSGGGMLNLYIHY